MTEHNTSSSYLKLSGVRKEFGAFTALKAIDLEISQGEFVCFLGPSGCGKTTLLRIIAGLETPTAGSIQQGGRDITTAPPAERDYGIVFQSYALFPNLTVADNVAYGLVNRKTPRAEVQRRVEELVKLVGLPGSERKFPGQLSGGQQQRIALARALATSPGLLLLDEPLSALDALERVRLRQEIRALQQKVGVTTIMVTHDQEEALSVADRIVVMNHGVIEQVGDAISVYREPATPFVADFVGKVNVLPGRIDAGELNVGQFRLRTEASSRAADGEAKVYLRPEDVLARPVAGGTASFAPDDPCVFDAVIEKIEFLGSFCHVHVASAAFAPHRLTVYLSLNFLTEQALTVGSALRLKLLPERLRVF
ncbi:putative 2-aminoethylphosphonate ABC transporter ATP-binding protein [Casimicrobium huifangae]|uniref:putative 2-aminoethylphosphonate ABC transporter ATP-binding protein n=1 Tax=Casimicrobium huifangae TaxID=2591109 RepID=UPI00378322DE